MHGLGRLMVGLAMVDFVAESLALRTNLSKFGRRDSFGCESVASPFGAKQSWYLDFDVD
jgi:hypothetical protein